MNRRIMLRFCDALSGLAPPGGTLCDMKTARSAYRSNRTLTNTELQRPTERDGGDVTDGRYDADLLKTGMHKPQQAWKTANHTSG
jgi:hypothetical protein